VRWITPPDAEATPPGCVLSASLRIEIRRITRQAQVRRAPGIACIYELFLTLPVTA
jgi:hypothetical protein